MTDAELIKSRIDIVDFLSEYIQLKKAGRNFKALCPFHPERTPSFIVSPERGSWHCFGACAEGGDVITFLQKWEGIEFIEALKILAQRVGVTLSSHNPSENVKLKEKLYEVNHLAAEFFHFLLISHKLGERARAYLKNRGIRDETVKTFTLGYAPESWDSLMQFLTKKGYEITDLYTSGLLVKSEKGTYYDRFRGRLIFTLKDHRGNIVGFSGRKLPPHEEKEAKYVNTSETPIYSKGNTLYGLNLTKEAIKKENLAVVVEGEFDLLSSFQSGVTSVVAIKGSALTEGQALLLKRFTENVVLALDSDFAGNEAAKRGIEIVENTGLTVRMVRLPVGKDPAECIEKDPYLWKKSVKTAIPIYDFIIDNALSKYGKEDALGKKKVGAEAVPFLAKIENPIVASHYIKYLAGQLAVGEESIELMIRQFRKKKEATGETQVLVTSKPRDILLEEYLLSLIVQGQHPHKAMEDIQTIILLDDFGQPPVRKIIEQLILYLKIHKKLDIKKFSDLLTPEITPTFDRALMVDIEQIISAKDIFTRELLRCAQEIKRQSLRRRANDLSTKIRQEEENGDEAAIEKLQEELRMLLAKKGEIDKSI